MVQLFSLFISKPYSTNIMGPAENMLSYPLMPVYVLASRGCNKLQEAVYCFTVLELLSLKVKFRRPLWALEFFSS